MTSLPLPPIITGHRRRPTQQHPILKRPYEHFLHCPQCGRHQNAPPSAPLFTCEHCGFALHFNPACAAGAFLQAPDGRLLFIRRAKDPARGKLALPGGFIDCAERAEDALRREILEEVGLTVGPLHFLCSQLNDYEYRGVDYPVVDFFFCASVKDPKAARALDDVAELLWLAPASVVLESLAFRSIQKAFNIHQGSDRAQA